MGRRTRDFKAEYARRIANAAARGLSRSQARGHARAHEAPLRPSSGKGTSSDLQLEGALKHLRNGVSLTEAARLGQMSRERLRRFVMSSAGARYEQRRWILNDNRPRRVPILSQAKTAVVVVPGFEEASLAGNYANDVGRFLRTNDTQFLTPYSGRGVKDSKGRFHPFETDPNAIYRLASADLPVFHEIYEIVQ